MCNPMRATFVLAAVLALMGAFAGGLPTHNTSAQAGTPAASPAATAEATLLSVTVDSLLLPGPDAIIIFGRGTYAPGARETCICPTEQGTLVEYQESGTALIEREQGGRLIRGANTDHPDEQRAPAGVPFGFGPGDALVGQALPRSTTIVGSEPAVHLYVLILAPTGPPTPDPSDVGEITPENLGFAQGSWPELAAGPVTILLFRTVLDPGESLSAPAGGTQLVFQETGKADALVVADDGTASNGGDGPIGVLVLSLAPASGTATPTS